MIISLVPGPELMLLLPVVMLEVAVTIRLYLIVLDKFDIDQCTSILQYPKKATSLLSSYVCVKDAELVF